MTHLNFICGLCGYNKPYCAKIKLSNNVDVAKGELLYYDEATLSVTTERGNLTTIAGVCAETYKAEKDEFHPTYGSGYVSVILSKDALYRISPYVIESNNGGGNLSVVKTTIPYVDAMATMGIVGSKLMLIEKAYNSAHSGSVGSEYEITSVKSDTSKLVFTIDYVGGMSAGDKYILVPPYGFGQFGLDDNKEICIKTDTSGDFTVIKADADGYVVTLRAQD